MDHHADVGRDAGSMDAPPPTSRRSDNQGYIDEMARSRGYVLDFHKIMAKHDFDVLKASNMLVKSVYLDRRSLDRKTKELIFVGSLTAMRASKRHIQSHINAAFDAGATPQEVLEAIEITLPEAGVVAFQEGLEAWKEVTGADGLEPTSDVTRGSTGIDGSGD
ncbi:MAG: carboxymuconolactone decarboxylase family protein [Sciscionella sp.]